MGIIYRYFQISQDDRVLRPPKLIYEKSYTKENRPKEEAMQMYVEKAAETEYIDFLEKPYLLVSNEFKNVVKMYNKEIECRLVILAEKENQTQAVYWYIDLSDPDCIVKQKNDAAGNSTPEIFVDESKLNGLNFFKKVNHFKTSYFVGLDLAESLLRRCLVGFKLEGVAHTKEVGL